MSKTFFNLDILPETNIFRRYLYDLLKINTSVFLLRKYGTILSLAIETQPVMGRVHTYD